MTNTTCTSCQVETRLFSEDPEVRESVTRQERNHWSLWGCTCSEEDSRNAQEWMEMVTR